MNFESDDYLISSIRRGGREREAATDYLMKKYIGYVHTFRRKLSLVKEEALDCFIDALADVVEQIGNGTFKRKSKVSTYLYKVTYFRCVDKVRKKKSEKYIENEFPELEDFSQNISEKIEIESEVRKLKNLLDNIGSPCKDILLDWAWWGYSMVEIAERNELGSAQIAKSRKYQCLMQLRKITGIKK